MNEQVWWYLVRSSGVIAWLLLTAAVLWGILLSTDLFKNQRRPAWLLDLHRWLGGLMLTFVGVHIAALVADSYVHFDLFDLFVPFASEWKPIPVAFGVVALWALVAVQVSSLMMKRLSKKVWRGIHLTSYATFWITSLHGTFAGTDATQPLYVATSSAAVVAVCAATTYRVLNGRPSRKKKPSPRAVPQEPDLAKV